MTTYSRRTFLQQSVGAVAALAAGSTLARSDVNSRIRVAVVGCNSRGQAHLNGFKDNLIALCDCDQQVLGHIAHQFAENHGRDLDQIGDFRRLLDRHDIDAISIATPNHTHALIATLAAQAGKHVYCEKPLSYNLWEGQQLVNAAKKYDRIIQCGTQGRSYRTLQQAVDYVQRGNLGRIKRVVCTCYKPRPSIGKSDQPLQVPKHLDYDLWCGPAEQQVLFRPERNSSGGYNPHYDWHWDYNTGNGDLGNQGVHQLDIARWFLGASSLPPRVVSFGGRFGYDDAGDTANTQVVYFDYPQAPLLFEARGLPKSKSAQVKWGASMDSYRGSQVGVVVECDRGHILSTSAYDKVQAFGLDGEEIERWEGGSEQDHFDNFLEAVRSHNRKVLNADVVEGHLSSALCHVGNISHRLGERQSAKDILQSLQTRSDLYEAVERMFAHLSANEVDIDRPIVSAGAWIEIDSLSGDFVDNNSANDFRRRANLNSFSVPEVV